MFYMCCCRAGVSRQFCSSEGSSKRKRKHLFSALLLFNEHSELADITALQPWEPKAGASWGPREVIRRKHDINFLGGAKGIFYFIF